MNKDISKRIALDVILGISIIFGWWFVAIPLAILGTWVFPYYGELIIFAIMHDALYGMNGVSGLLGYVYIIVSVVILVVMALVKLRFRS